MKTNSQILLSSRLYMGDIDGNGMDNLIEVDGRHLYVFDAHIEHKPLLEHVFSAPVKRLIIGDFVASGRERGKDQIIALLQDGTMQGWAISDDQKSLWWWFTQPAIVQDGEHFIVGDFDGDTADEIMVYNPTSGGLRIFERQTGAGFVPLPNFIPGVLSSHDLKNKLILAGEFGASATRKDILVLDKPTGVVKRFDSVVNTMGKHTFVHAFTTASGQFSNGDDVIVANVNNGAHDSLIVRSRTLGTYRLLKVAMVNGHLVPDTGAIAGQLPVKPNAGRIQACKVRELNLRDETPWKRNDIIWYNSSTQEIIRTDARTDPGTNKFTYWFAYSSDIVTEPIRVAEKKPWAVILCRFKGMPGNAGVETLFREIFTPGSGGLVEYWHDVTHGAIDIADSKVFGFVELPKERKDCALPRAELIDMAISSARNAGFEPVTGFFGQIAVFTHNFSVDGAPPGADWEDPIWGRFWLDGSANGLRISAPPHGHDATYLAHEMGHCMGMGHDLATDLVTHYGDPDCIMGGATAFIHPKWNVRFGPSICFSHLSLKNWSLSRRIKTVPATWANGLTFIMAAKSDARIIGNLGVILPSNNGNFNYFLDYQPNRGWDRGFAQSHLLIRRQFNGTSAFLGSVNIPGTIGTTANFIEPTGKVKFEVKKIRADDRTIEVKVSRVV